MEFAGIEGLLRFATTAAFLQRFALSSLEELTSTSFRLIRQNIRHTLALSPVRCTIRSREEKEE
jgi:hypothetical protein